MSMYNKLFGKILDSSIWLESDSTRIVWMTLIAAMDEHGFCQFASVNNLAHRAIVSPENTDQAVKVLENPDPDSSDPENEGRRIEKVPGGWMVLNAHKYRALVTRANVQENTRNRVRAFRERKRSVTKGNAAVTQVTKPVTPSDTDTDTDTKEKPLASTALAVPAAALGKVVGLMPVLKPKGEYAIYEVDVGGWKDTFPGVDVDRELRKAKQWLIDNPTKQKTRAGIRNYINRWLTKVQDGGAYGTTSSTMGRGQGRTNRNLEAFERANDSDRGSEAHGYLGGGTAGRG